VTDFKHCRILSTNSQAVMRIQALNMSIKQRFRSFRENQAFTGRTTFKIIQSISRIGTNPPASSGFPNPQSPKLQEESSPLGKLFHSNMLLHKVDCWGSLTGSPVRTKPQFWHRRSTRCSSGPLKPTEFPTLSLAQFRC
jgi:hypothetical protein